MTADQINRILREERSMARAQMADELRAEISGVEYVSRMWLMDLIDRLESPTIEEDSK